MTGDVVRLSPDVAAVVREMSADMGGEATPAQVVRRGLILLDFYRTLTPDEVLVVYDETTRKAERVTFDFGPSDV